jgi:hypothetical protein
MNISDYPMTLRNPPPPETKCQNVVVVVKFPILIKKSLWLERIRVGITIFIMSHCPMHNGLG